MRVVICGDTHIGAVFGLGGSNGKGGNTRVDDYEKTLNYIIDYAIKNKVDAFVQTGDAFEHRTPSPEHIAVLNRAIKRLSMANITAVVIMGNHDYRRSGSIFTSAISSLAAKDYPNVRVVLEPQVMKFHDKSGKGASIILLPYRDRRMYPGKTVEEDSKAYEAEVKSLINSCSSNQPIIAVGHNFFLERSYSDYGGHEVMVNVEAFKGCDMVTMGHLHQFRIVRKKDPIAIYSGSMEKLNFGDEKIDKHFIDYNTDTKKTNIIKCPSRELRDLKINLLECNHDNLSSTLESKIKEFNLDEIIVRAKLVVRDNLISFIKKNQVEKMLYDRGAFYVSKILIEPVFNRIVRDNAILKQTGDINMFKAFLKDQAFDEDLKEELLTEAQSIII